MLKIKLVRIGKKKQPSYRIVVAESKTKRSGKYIHQVGFYNPLAKPSTIKFDQKSYDLWLKKGAQPTKKVRKLLEKS